ncbi:MAG: hypothetical protein Kow00124_20130 [Anaerolineae bacterium]
MHSGTMALQLSSLIPSGMPPDQALAAVMSLNHTVLVRRVADQGFGLLEITTAPMLFLPHPGEVHLHDSPITLELPRVEDALDSLAYIRMVHPALLP